LSDGFNKMLSQIQSRQEERDLAEEALRESEDRYRGLVESSPEPIIVEQDLKIVYMNPVGLQMLGYDSIQEVQGMAVEALLYSPDAVLRNNPEQQPVSPMEIQFKSKDGRPVDVEVSFIRTTYQGKPATQGIARNITEKKLLQQSAQRMERLAAIGEFAAVIAHEMRNSLGSISLNFRYLSEKLQVPETYQKNFNNIQKSIERIQEVIKEILEFSRPAPPVFRKVPIEKVLDSSILTVEKDLEHAGVLLERNYSSISKDVSVDANQISRVFVNLFLNAVQAASSGGTITVRTEEDSQKVFVHIEDTGKGIPTENLKKIFDPFFTTRPEGVGLGLAIVSRTLEQHSAEICVKSEVGKGTGFTITFPVAK
jgi:PAS domain S-box-containing protein